jgi:hypothetical protein
VQRVIESSLSKNIVVNHLRRVDQEATDHAGESEAEDLDGEDGTNLVTLGQRASWSAILFRQEKKGKKEVIKTTGKKRKIRKKKGKEKGGKKKKKERENKSDMFGEIRGLSWLPTHCPP